MIVIMEWMTTCLIGRLIGVDWLIDLSVGLVDGRDCLELASSFHLLIDIILSEWLIDLDWLTWYHWFEVSSDWLIWWGVIHWLIMWLHGFMVDSCDHVVYIYALNKRWIDWGFWYEWREPLSWYHYTDRLFWFVWFNELLCMIDLMQSIAWWLIWWLVIAYALGWSIEDWNDWRNISLMIDHGIPGTPIQC